MSILKFRFISLVTSTLLTSVSYTTVQANTGDSQCPCLTQSQLASKLPSGYYVPDPNDNSTNTTKLKIQISSTDYYYEQSYGTGTCESHDNDKPPKCAESNGTPLPDAQRPNWCANQWCFVDQNSCGNGKKSIPNGNNLKDNSNELIYYSFDTCGVSNSWSGSMAPVKLAVEGHITDIRNAIEDGWLIYKDAVTSCDYTTAYYASCYPGNWGTDTSQTTWPLFYIKNDGTRKYYRYDTTRVLTFNKLGAHPNNDLISNSLKCMVDRVVNPEVMKVAAKQHDGSRLGYIYIGFQADGSFAEYPKTNGYCDDTSQDRYDPRIRPWWAVSVSGTKDIVLVIDKSGSMGSYNRMALAKQAAKAVLRTLTWVDFVSVVAFSDNVMYASKHLVPATADNISDLNAWIDALTDDGSTNYRSSLLGAMRMLADAKNSNSCWSSMCSSTLIFLSDGQPTSWDSSDLQNLVDTNAECDYCVKTHCFYLGGIPSAQSEQIMKDVASKDNNGQPKYTWVPDGMGDLLGHMTRYYELLTEDMDKSLVRWTKYLDWSSQQTVIGACATALDRTSNEIDRKKPVLSVICMDINLIQPISTLQQDITGFPVFLRQIENTARTCAGSSMPPQTLMDSTCSDQHGEKHVVAPGVDAMASSANGNLSFNFGILSSGLIMVLSSVLI